jgi:hypothetical protein
MEKLIHPNAIKASNLLRLSALICLISYLLWNDHKSFLEAEVVLLTIVLLIVSAYLIRKGYAWTRWALLLIFFIPGIILIIIAFPFLFKQGLIDGSISLLQVVIQTIAVILLFIPFKPVIKLKEQDV